MILSQKTILLPSTSQVKDKDARKWMDDLSSVLDQKFRKIDLIIRQPDSGWSVTAGYTKDKSFNPETAALLEVARVLGTLIDTLKDRGNLGA